MGDVRPLDLIDRFYLAFGPCCAGCDHWQHEPERPRPLGYCHKQVISQGKAFDLHGPGVVSKLDMYQVTEKTHWCPMFEDTFDWSILGETPRQNQQPTS